VVEGIQFQALVTHTIFERFQVLVAPGLTWWNVVNATLAGSEFVEGVGSEFGPVVAPQHQGCYAMGNDFLYLVDVFLARYPTVGHVKD